MDRRIRIFLNLLVLCCGTARGDVYSQLGEARIVDDSGKYYVVVQRKGGPVFASPIGGPWTLTIVAPSQTRLPSLQLIRFCGQRTNTSSAWLTRMSAFARAMMCWVIAS